MPWVPMCSLNGEIIRLQKSSSVDISAPYRPGNRICLTKDLITPSSPLTRGFVKTDGSKTVIYHVESWKPGEMSENGGLGDEIEAVIMRALTHRERRNILKIIDYSNGGVVYSGILGETGLSTGRLNYHLKELEGFIEKDEERRYLLTALGKKAIRLMRGIQEDIDESYEGYVSVAKASRRTFIKRNLDRAFYVIATLLLIGPLFTIWLYTMKPQTWWIGGLTWTFYLILVYLMDRGRKGSPKYVLGFINWLEWRLYGNRSDINGAKFPGSKLMIGLLIGVVIGAIFDKVGAGLLLGLFIGAAMEI